MKKNVRHYSIFLSLLWLSHMMTAQIPPTSGLPLKWQYLFSYPSGSSLYPEDVILNHAGNLCFLHNTGLLEGSLFTEINVQSGAIINQHYNNTDDLGFRLVGVELKESQDDDKVIILGNRIISNAVQAIPPVGTLATQTIDNQQITTWAPSWQAGGVISRNDRGLPSILQAATGDYWIAEPFVGSDNQNVAWVRSVDATNGLLKDTLFILGRPLRNGAPVGNYFDFSRIRGFEQLSNGQYLLLYAQQRNPDQPQLIVNELVWLDENGAFVKRLDISAETEYATLPNLQVINDRVLVYGTIQPPSSTPDAAPETGLAILTSTGEMIWSSGMNTGPVFRFSELAIRDNGSFILFETEPLEPNKILLSNWTTGAVSTVPLGVIKFEDANFRVTCTKALSLPDQDIMLMLQLDRFNGPPSPNADPENIYHVALSVQNTDLGISANLETGAGQPAFQIDPNPNNGQFNIAGDFSNYRQIEILDATGKQVYESSNLQDAQINLSRLASGMYWVCLKSVSGYRTVRKMMIR